MLLDYRNTSFWITISVVALVCWVLLSIYRLTLHPLARFPGPSLAAISSLPYCWSSLNGRQAFDTLALHEKYGPVVRILPNELSFASTQSWKDIYIGPTTSLTDASKTTLPSTQPVPLPKAAFYDGFTQTVPTILTERNQQKHASMKQYLAPAFSDKTLRAQEPLVAEYIDNFVQRIGDESDPTGPGLDMNKWFNLLTFDIIGDLAFGNSFNGIRSGETHPWVAVVLSFVQAGCVIDIFSKNILFGLLWVIAHPLLTITLALGARGNIIYASKTIDKRLEMDTQRPDIVNNIRSKINDEELPVEELKAHSSNIIFAGSETTASALSACIWYLGKHPEVYQKLCDEIRGSTTSYSQIDNAHTTRMRYLQAVCLEALRIYPPVPVGLPRIVTDNNTIIDGHVLPRGTTVSTHQYAASMLETNYKNPREFMPERWMNDGERGETGASRPFSLGPRVCLGRGLAWLELRTTLAKMLYRYDVQINEEVSTSDWQRDSQIFLVWKRPNLHAWFIPRDVNSD